MKGVGFLDTGEDVSKNRLILMLCCLLSLQTIWEYGF